MSAVIVVSESTLTDRYQTTVPVVVRKTLGLNKREKIRYTIRPNGDVLLSKADQVDEDPVLGHFLSFLANDLATNPARIRAVGNDLSKRIHSLVSGVEFDLDSPLSDKDE